MQLLRRSLALQLFTLWLAAFVLAVAQIWGETLRSREFVVLTPLPSWRALPVISPLFRNYPFLATGVYIVPVVALVASVALLARRAISVVRMIQSTPVAR